MYASCGQSCNLLIRGD